MRKKNLISPDAAGPTAATFRRRDGLTRLLTPDRRRLYAAFAISCLVHSGILIAGRTVVAPPGTPGDDLVCVFMIGSIQGKDEPIPADAASIPAPERAATLDGTTTRRDRAAEKNRAAEADDAATTASLAQPDSPAAGTDIPPPHRDREAETSLPPLAASLPARGEDGRTARTAGGADEYFDVIRRRISEKKEFPSEALNQGSRGTSLVAFRLYRDGTISGVRLVRSSRSPILDDEAQGTVRRAAPFPPIPDRFEPDAMDLQVPISFEIEKQR